MHMQVDRLLTVPEVCEHLAVSRSRLYQLLSEGRVQARKCGSRTLVPEGELKRFIETLPPARFGKLATRPA